MHKLHQKLSDHYARKYTIFQKHLSMALIFLYNLLNARGIECICLPNQVNVFLYSLTRTKLCTTLALTPPFLHLHNILKLTCLIKKNSFIGFHKHLLRVLFFYIMY